MNGRLTSENRFVALTALILTAIFFASIYAGYSAAKLYPIEEELKKFFEVFGGYLNDPILLALIIFANNAGKGFIAMLAGFFFGIFPIMFVALNGYIVGAVISWREPDWGIFKIIAAILPHGILEIPGIIIACSYGVWLGYRFYLALFKGEEFKKYLLKAVRIYLRVILPVLFVAAFIEAFITPIVVGLT
jgi:stage II sporulation protein M